MTGRPTRVANDADLQGAAVIKGDGLELVVTLGTGVGTAMFYDGHLLPHLEFAHHPLRKGRTYNEVLGDAARRKAGNRKWAQRVAETVETLRALTFFDHCYIGGGNSVRLSDLPDDVTVVDNAAGILGGIKLWSVTETLGTATSPATPSSRPAPAARRTRRAPSGATTAKAPARKAAPAPARKAAGQPAVRKRAATGTARTTAAPATPAAPRRRRVSRPEGA
jgi:predicted NBD/HSP70 family sugar kinase